jgi:hypothetical protein
VTPDDGSPSLPLIGPIGAFAGGLGCMGLLLVVGVGLMVALIVFGSRSAKRRRAALQAFAAQRGWLWQESEPELARRWHGYPFGTGSRHRVHQVLTGSHRGREIVLFEYSYETSSTDSEGGSSTTTHRYTVCVVRLPAPLPGMEVGRHSFLHRLAGITGRRDVQFDDPAFNKAFRVRAADERVARAVVSRPTIDLLLSRPSVPWRIEGEDMLCWSPGVIDPAKTMPQLDMLIDIVEQVPSSVWTTRPATPE